MSRSGDRHLLLQMYEALLAVYGPQRWWPADSAVEVVIGAILTQNTAWSNVRRAIREMKRARCLDFRAIHAMDLDTLGSVIRPAGTFRVKARRLKKFASWLVERHGGDLQAALAGQVDRVRHELLQIHGIGPETADAILLYAGRKATFVVDAYTRRILRRHHLADGHSSYRAVQALFEQALPRDTQLYNEYHALLVEIGKRHCKARAECTHCPLENWPHDETA